MNMDNLTNNAFLRQIKYSANTIYNSVQKLINTPQKIGVYGTGIYAAYIVKNLKKWSVNVDYFVVDDEYYRDNIADNVFKISDLPRFNDSILIIGFETLIGKEEILLNKKKNVLKFAPQIEIIDFAHCYIDYDFVTYKYVLDNYRGFCDTYNMLEDDLSRRVMVEYVNTCISGCVNNLELLNQDCKHDYDYDLLYHDDIINGLLVECGAFNGKTALEISEYLKKKKGNNKILALEPDSGNFDLMKKNIKDSQNIIPLKFGVASCDGEVFFDEQGGSGSTIVNKVGPSSDDYSKIVVKSIDTIKKEYGEIHSVLMDIEGGELDVLKGAKETIKSCRPLFAVRVYHKKDDLITIPQFFMGLNAKYKLYLRNSQSTRGHLDLTLYAI